MADGGATFKSATNLGNVNFSGSRRTQRILAVDTLDQRERTDWFKFRASGSQIRTIAANAAFLSSSSSDIDDEDNTTAISGLKAVLYFKRSGESGVGRRLGMLESKFNSGSAFVYPKGVGTYYLRVIRNTDALASTAYGFAFAIDFSPSNLTTNDSPGGNPFFF
jgi:hypothetical protein